MAAAVVGLNVAVPAGAVPTDGGFPLAWAAELFAHAPAWSAPGGVPVQPEGTAAGKDHHVPAGATASNGGAGREPRAVPGALPAERRHTPEVKRATTPAIAGEHSFREGTSRRVASAATASSDVYQNPDGSYTRKVYEKPVNYRAADGSWKPIDSTLVREPAGGAAGRTAERGRLRQKAGASAISFAPRADDEALADIRLGEGIGIAYSLLGAAAVEPETDGATARYRDVFPGVDVELTVKPSGVKESLVLHSPDAGNSWVFPLELDGLSAEVDAHGAVLLRDVAGEQRAWIPPGYMFDSRFDEKFGGFTESRAVTYELVEVAGVPALRVTADEAWLRDPQRVYPVTVDPTTYFQTTGDTFVSSATPGAANGGMEELRVGTWNGGGDKSRSFLHFTGFGSTYAGARISSASLRLYLSWAYTCNARPFSVYEINESWTVSGTRNYPGPSYRTPAVGSASPDPGVACTNTSGDRTIGKWVTVPLDLATIQDWALGGTNHGLALVASESNSEQWKKFTSGNPPVAGLDPYLSITYADNVAPQINAQSPANGYAAPTLTPELMATAKDPDAWPSALKYNFQVYDSKAIKLFESGQVSARAWKIPAGRLKWGQTYLWTVIASDGDKPSSSQKFYSFSTVAPQPAITSALSQNGGHGFDPSVGNYTTAATDASVSTVGPALAIQRSYNSLDPRRAGAFGAGWSTLLDAAVTAQATDGGSSPNVAVVRYPDGREVAFGRNADGSYTPPPGRFATLTAVTGGFRLVDKDGTAYTFTALTSVADAQGRALTITYDPDTKRATALTSASGRSLHVAWSTPAGGTSAHVTTVTTDPAQPSQPNTALAWTYDYTGDQLTEVCPPTSATACTGYSYQDGVSRQSGAVQNAGPTSYWRLGEASGTVAASAVQANQGTDNGTYTDVTLGLPGPEAGTPATAAGFNGTSSNVHLPANIISQGSYQSVSLWFKAQPGIPAAPLFSYENDPVTKTSTSLSYVPALYIGTSGKLNAGFWTDGGITPMVTDDPVTDGQWHHAVLVGAGNTQWLYLDGVLRRTKTGTFAMHAGSNANTYVGAGFLGGRWPDQPRYTTANNTGYPAFFTGSIAEVALFDRPLTAQDAAALHHGGQAPSAPVLDAVLRPSGSAAAQVGYDAADGTVRTVTDAAGGVWQIGRGEVTGSHQAYSGTVLSAGPAEYWRLAESGVTEAVNEVNGGAAIYNQVTLGAAGGPFDDPARDDDNTTVGQFNGTSSYMALPAEDIPQAGPYSVSMWFKMNAGSTAGGVLFSFQTLPVGESPSSNWVPALYVGADGRLRGRLCWCSGTSPMTSTAAVNDGKWHHVAIAATATGQTTYLDGAAIGTLARAIETTTSQHIYVGAGFTKSWPSPSTNPSGFFPGQIAEVALFRSALTDAQVTQQHGARAKSSGVPVRTVTVTDPADQPVSYVYDVPMGRKIAETDALGNKTQYGYDEGGFLRTVTDPNGDVTTTQHDARGNTVASTTCQDRSAGRCSTSYYSYYPDNSTRVLTPDPRNDVLLTVRDGRSSSDADNRFLTTFGYDAKGNRTTVTDPLGRLTTTAYTDATTVAAADGGFAPPGLPYRLTTPGGAVQTVTYYVSGDVATVTDPAGMVTTFTYDGLGRVLTRTETTETFPDGLTTTFSYDGLGRLVTQTDPPVTNRVTGAVHTARTTMAYDDDGNLTARTVADLTGGDASRTESATYNDRGQQVTQTDPDGRVTEFGYDAYGNIASETGPDGRTVRTEYGPTGNVLTTTLLGYTGDPNHPEPARDLVLESYAYDPAGRLASITDAMGWETTYRYTDNGLTTTVMRRDPSTGESFVVQSNTYDAAGHLVEQVTNDGATTTSYAVDAVGRTTAATLDPDGLARTTTITHSPDDYVLKQVVAGPSGTVEHTEAAYDPLGRLTERTVHTGRLEAGAVTPHARWRLDDGSGPVAADSAGNNAGTLSGGVTWSTDRGGAAVFDGTGVITTAGPTVDTSADFTVAAWVYLTDNATKQKVLAASGAQQDAFDLQYDSGNGRWKFNMKTADVANATVVAARSNSTAAVNTWTHLAGVFDADTGTMSLYVNGVLEDTDSNPTPFNATGPFLLGAGTFNAVQGGHWKGRTSDVQVYSRELTAAEVADVRSGAAPDAQPQVLRTTYTVDSGGLTTAVTDPNGHTTSYAHDEAGRVVVTSGPAVPTETGGGTPVLSRPVSYVGYDTFGAPVETKDPNGNVTVSAFDAAGRMLSTRLPEYTPPGAADPVAATVSRTYDALGQLTTVTDPLGKTTTYEYDQLGRVTKVTAPNGGVATYSYDLLGDRLSATDPTGARSTATYDYLGRTRTSTDVVRQTGSAHTTDYGYGTGGWLSTVTSPAGVVTEATYNAAGETATSVDGAGNTTSYAYDAAGRPIRTTLPDGTYSTVNYDWAGRALSLREHDPAGTVLTVRSQEYDGLGNVTAATDARRTTVRFDYDAAGRLSSQLEPISASDAITTSFGYDPAGNQTRFTDGRGNAFLTSYNSWNLPQTRVEPATAAQPGLADRTFTWVYDAGGRIREQRLPGGVTVTNSYDELSNLTGQSGAGAEAATAARSFGYDLAGRLTSASGPGGTNEFSYDDRGLLLSASGPSGDATFAYNPDGSMLSRQDAAGQTSYTYDDAGRLATLANPTAGVQSTYTYNSLAQVRTVAYGGGNTRWFGYDNLHRLTSDELKTAGGASIARIEYGYDANGNETSKTTTGFAGSSTNVYSYDLANRLTSWTANGNPTVYAYDKSGNRLQAGARLFTYDARNQLTSTSDGQTYEYTARGTLRRTASGGQTVETLADAFGQVVSQQTAGGAAQTYEYDALGRLLRGGFSYSGQGNTLAADGSATYVRDVVDDVVGVSSGGVNRLVWTDLHDDVVAQFTAGGTALAGSRSYDPLGTELAATSMLGSLGYQSEWTDIATGRVNMWSRWYNAETGQFDTRDAAEVSAVGASVRANRFAYGDANPLTTIDPTGHWGWSSAWNAVKSTAQKVTSAVVSTAKTAYSYASYYASTAYNYAVSAAKSAYNYAKNAYNYAKDKVKQAKDFVAKKVNEGRKWVGQQVAKAKQVVSKAYQAAKKAGKAILAKTVKVVTTTVNKVKDAYKATEKWVKENKDLLIEIAAVAGAVLAGLACTAVTAGAGAVACMVGAAALINLAKDSAQGKINDWGDAFGSLGTGALQGLAGGAGGLVAGKVAGLAATRLGSYAATVGGRTLAGGLAGGAGDAVGQAIGTGRVDWGSVMMSATIGAVSGGKSRGGIARPGGGGSPGAVGAGRSPSRSDSGRAGCLHSFDPDTPVLMADGTARPIDEVNVGDRVLATDPVNGETRAQQVTALHLNRDEDLTDVEVVRVGGGARAPNQTGPAAPVVLKTTAHHPFWDASTNEWVDAAHLVPGQSLLLGPDGEVQKVTAVRNHTGAKLMRDLTVAHTHTYYVIAGNTPVLVHNCGGGEVPHFKAYPQEFLDQAAKYGKGGVRELPDGRFRFYGEIAEARTPGEMVGRRLVREWNPDTGATRIWHETLDHSGNVRIVRPDVGATGGSKVHYMFDAGGNYTGSW